MLRFSANRNLAGLALALTLPFTAARPASGAERSVEWLRQFGTAADDGAWLVATAPSGIYLAGTTNGALSGQERLGTQDVFLRKYDAAGNEAWTRQFAAPAGVKPLGLAVDASSIYIAGYAHGGTGAGRGNVFVRRHDLEGNEIWSRQFKSRGEETPRAVYVDAGGVYVAGSVRGALPGQSSAGGLDAFVRRYDADGNELWTRQFGAAEADSANAVVADATGVYVAGSTKGALAGSNAGDADAFVRKYDLDGNEVWTRQFGTEGADFGFGISVAAGRIYVSGATEGAFRGYANAGGMDAFVRELDADGNETWTAQFGTDGADWATSVSARGGVAYVVGRTDGDLSHEPSSGGYDAFVAKFTCNPTVIAAIPPVENSIARNPNR
ncbi:MAG: hypothetical protein KIT09_12555 [Bryobacteraceae bacterium]|nr:hypothetical protein [Bryobacteraceae bacterium]